MLELNALIIIRELFDVDLAARRQRETLFTFFETTLDRRIGSTNHELEAPFGEHNYEKPPLRSRIDLSIIGGNWIAFLWEFTEIIII